MKAFGGSHVGNPITLKIKYALPTKKTLIEFIWIINLRGIVSFFLRRNKAGVFSAVEIPYFPLVLRQTQAPLRGPTLRHPSGTFQSAAGRPQGF